MFGFVHFAFKRLLSRFGILLLTLISTSLAIALTVAIPEFSNAASKRIMQEELGKRVHSSIDHRFAVRFAMPVYDPNSMDLASAARTRDWMGQTLSRNLGLRVSSVYVESLSPTLYLTPRPGDAYHDPEMIHALRIGAVPDAAAHLVVAVGEPLDAPGEAQMLQVWVERGLAESRGYLVGDVYHLSDPATPQGEPVEATIAGL